MSEETGFENFALSTMKYAVQKECSDSSRSNISSIFCSDTKICKIWNAKLMSKFQQSNILWKQMALVLQSHKNYYTLSLFVVAFLRLCYELYLSFQSFFQFANFYFLIPPLFRSTLMRVDLSEFLLQFWKKKRGVRPSGSTSRFLQKENTCWKEALFV